MRRPRLPELEATQMALVDAAVLEVVSGHGYHTRARIVEATRRRLDAIALPHRDYTAIVRMSLQRLRAAGSIHTAGGGNAMWFASAP